MAVPPVKSFANEPGGGLTYALGGINALQNAQILKRINAVKEQYAPQLTQADIASKNAYAQLVGLQPLGKILGNENAYSNINDEQKNAINDRFLKAGGVGRLPFPENNVNNNAINQMSHPSGISHNPSTNSISRRFVDKLMNSFSNKPNIPSSQTMNAINTQSQNRPLEMLVNTGNAAPNSTDNINHDLDAKFLAQISTPEGQRALEEEEKRVAARIEASDRNLTNAEKTGQFKGTIKQGEMEGKYRAEALRDIGKSQLALSNSGTALANLTKIVKDPIFQNMSTLDAFRDKQLAVLKVIGSDAEKKILGRYTAAAKNLIVNTVAGMGSRHLVREYDLASQQKIDDKDTIPSAEGKLQNAIELHDIAEKKNSIVKDFLKQGIDEATAVEQANKMIDVGAIERRTAALLENKITDADIDATAKKRGMTREQVIARLKQEGRYNG